MNGGGGTAAWLPDGRLHLQQGPIDLICFAEGPAAREALHAAQTVFVGVLDTLVSELPLLRVPAGAEPAPVRGPVAQRMVAAVHPHRARFITPMAAVAGSVADHVLHAMRAAGPLARAYVNNGGDIAVHVAPGFVPPPQPSPASQGREPLPPLQAKRSGGFNAEGVGPGWGRVDENALTIGLVRSLSRATPEGSILVTPDMNIGGIATSGWPGRSFSLGIAEAVTVLARDAATADAAATAIANAVNAEHPAIRRA
ncbi:MAG TPA: UPF0280 family protein, partial [Acetobacteraceae bacterium]|nr:UPF0280 family protein [Acetobacteraceae bacterium]